MEQLLTQTEYAVGLSREEYVRSQQVVTTTLRGKRLGLQPIISIILILMCVGTIVMEYRVTGIIDMGSAVIVALMIIAEVWIMLDIPRKLLKNQEEAYDSTLFSGHSFDGVITVDNEGITKRTADDTTHLKFSECDAYIETADMLLFCVTKGRSIVVPARYLTPQDAEATKKAAEAGMVPFRRYVVSPLVPLLQSKAPVVMPLPKNDEAQLALTVEYTESELKANLTDAVIRGFFKKIPYKMLAGLCLTMFIAFGSTISPLPVFLASMILLFFIDIIGVRFRTHRAVKASEGDVCRLRVELGEHTLRLVGRGEKSRRLAIPWERITRAVERPKEVEFFVEDERVVAIPKRCIPDMDELRTVVDAHVKV